MCLLTDCTCTRNCCTFTAAGVSPVPSPSPAATLAPTVTRGQSTDFQRAPSNQFVQPGQTLSFKGAVLSELADVFAYTYQPSQPYINQAVGYVLWPSIALAPNATVSMLANTYRVVGLFCQPDSMVLVGV